MGPEGVVGAIKCAARQSDGGKGRRGEEATELRDII